MKPFHSYWHSSEAMTVGIVTDSNAIIVEAPPIVRRFLGQPVSNLNRWMQKQKGYQWCYLGEI